MLIFNTKIDLNENWPFENTKRHQKSKGNIFSRIPVKFQLERITELGEIVNFQVFYIQKKDKESIHGISLLITLTIDNAYY